MQLGQLGKYKVLEKLGQGAMGEVFRAHDPVLGRDVAIKVLNEKLSADETARQRFQREARSAAQLNHPNIITVHDFGEEQGVAYMAMELLVGTDLRELIEKKRLATLEEKLALLEQILEGLAFAHSKGVVHRDLKPGNVHVLPDGKVKIMDFGLARRTQDAAATSVVMGTPYYMAPEQAEGEPPSARGDVFSAGALCYELLAGKRPFTGPTIAAVLFAVVHRPPQPLSEVAPELPPALGPFVARALAKSKDERYADGGEMLAALRAACTPANAQEPPSSEAVAPPRDLGPPLSARADTRGELRAAIEEIESFLADRVPPLMAADSVETFAESAPEGAAAEIWHWAGRQQTLAQEPLPLVEYLFHALHKLSAIGELDLTDKTRLISFLRAVGEELAAACEADEGERLRRALLHLGESEMVRTDALEMKPRLGSPDVTGRTPGLRRLSLIEHRLATARRDTPAALAVRRRLTSQALTVAANEAANEGELEEHLRRLRRHGIASGAEQVFRSLGQELAEWALPKDLAPDTADLGQADEVRAMKQIVSLPDDPVEVARRYRHLVSAATEQFNEGNLGGAVQMFELAGKLFSEKKVDPGYVEPIQKRGHEALDSTRLRQYLESPERHGQLQAVLAFFETGMGVRTLLDKLEGEERRDRRRLLLDLLVVHGHAARTAVRGRLVESLRIPVPDFARRNWIYLLRLLPRPVDTPMEAEIDAVCRFAGPGSSAFLAKEALLYLGHMRHPRAAQGLVGLLRAWEQHAGNAPEDLAGEAHAALDRVAAALARQSSPKTWGALVEHALSRRPALGGCLTRLAELGGYDLSSAPDVVQAITDEIRDGLPRGVLGRLVRKGQDLPALVTALAATRTPEVRELLEEVARRFAADEAGRAATRVLHASPPSAGSPAGFSGELDPFGLPALLVRLMENRSTGTLNLMPREGAGAPATVGVANGRVVASRWAHREGRDAFYQLFERPFGGKYAFDPSATPASAGVMGELATLVREGVRRARELRRTSAVVPADAPLEPTGSAPGTIADESEYELIVALWQKACAGVAAEKLEGELGADAFRILRPLAQWLEEGALRPVPPAREEAAEGK